MTNQIVCKKCIKTYRYDIGCGHSSTYKCPKCKHEVLVTHDEFCDKRENI